MSSKSLIVFVAVALLVACKTTEKAANKPVSLAEAKAASAEFIAAPRYTATRRSIRDIEIRVQSLVEDTEEEYVDDSRLLPESELELFLDDQDL